MENLNEKKQIEEMAKLKAINEMKAVIRDKTESCKTCSFYLNGLCDNACELEEDNQKICADLYDANYRKQEWISVDDRLPEKDGMYLIFSPYTNKEGGIVYCNRFLTKGNIIFPPNSFESISKVTHWMPLPEAPRMKGGAE